MPGRMSTLTRYYLAVAFVYFSAFLAIVLVAGRVDESAADGGTWWLPLFGAGFGPLMTWIAMGRFGNAGGSVYFVPTLMRVVFLEVLAMACVRTMAGMS